MIVGKPPSIAIGDIVVGAAGSGYLRRVTRVSASGSALTLETTDAALTDVVESGSFGNSIQVHLMPSASGRTVSGLTLGPTTAQYLAPGVTITNGGLSLDGTVLYSNSVCSGSGAQTCSNLSFVIPKGLIAFSPALDLGGHISNFSITEFHAIASGTLEYDADVTVTVSGTLNYHAEKTLATFATPFLIWIGPLPVKGVIKLDMVADFSANAVLALRGVTL
jgi:hypothetical protein